MALNSCGVRCTLCRVVGVNIELNKEGKATNALLANQAIKEGFKNLIEKILLEEDSKKLSELKFYEIKELVVYYQVSNRTDCTHRKSKK